jgi:hypothetical protein
MFLEMADDGLNGGTPFELALDLRRDAAGSGKHLLTLSISGSDPDVPEHTRMLGLLPDFDRPGASI